MSTQPDINALVDLVGVLTDIGIELLGIEIGRMESAGVDVLELGHKLTRATETRAALIAAAAAEPLPPPSPPS